MTSLTVQLPDWLAKELSDASQEFIAEMFELGLRTCKIERALAPYARGQTKLGAAAHLAGITESVMARYAYARGLEPRFSQDALAEELAWCQACCATRAPSSRPSNQPSSKLPYRRRLLNHLRRQLHVADRTHLTRRVLAGWRAGVGARQFFAGISSPAG